jgi:hypothetical protein
MRGGTVGISVVLALTVALAAALPASGKTLLDTPVYHAETKSYFELVAAPVGYSMRDKGSPEIDWLHAMRFAAQRIYKDTHGRLAIIKSQETNDFLVRTFNPPAAAWFGLRFYCDVRKLIWVTGEIHPLTGYKNWGPNWKAAGDAPCAPGLQWAPIALAHRDAGWKWEARGQVKEFYYFLVEFPTGHP